MAGEIIDGNQIAKELKGEITKLIQANLKKGLARPGLAVILVGEDPASIIYVRNKRKACEEVGILSFYFHLSANISQQELIERIITLNNDKTVNGILLQLPLPKHINADEVIEFINPYKDVDGFHPYNLGRLAQRRPLLQPCTPAGIMILLNRIHQTLKGKHAVIIGASNIVGRPMALLLLIAGTTITVCHRFTHDLPFFVKQADVLVSAVGKPGIIKGEWVKKESTVIDVGITRLPNGMITGDIQFAEAIKYASWITPVPGGVGPMTVAVLLRNTLIAAGYLSSNNQ